MNVAKRVFTLLSKVNGVLAFLGGAASLFLTLIISADVAMRYFYNRPIENVDEITEHALLFITFLSAAWVLKKGGHVKVDIVYDHFSPKTQKWIDLWNSLLGALVCLALTWFSGEATWLAFKRGTVFATTWSLPRGPILAVIPLGSFLLFMQFLEEIYQTLNKLKTGQHRTTTVPEKTR